MCPLPVVQLDVLAGTDSSGATNVAVAAAAGSSEEEIAAPPTTTKGAASAITHVEVGRAQLVAVKGVALDGPGVQAAVDRAIVRGDTALGSGAEVAFMPPMSGG